MKFEVEVKNGDVFVNGKFVQQLCWDNESVGMAVTEYLEGNIPEDKPVEKHSKKKYGVIFECVSEFIPIEVDDPNYLFDAADQYVDARIFNADDRVRNDFIAGAIDTETIQFVTDGAVYDYEKDEIVEYSDLLREYNEGK